MKAKGKVWIATIIGLVVVVVVLVGVKVGQIRAMIQAGQSFVPPPESVTSVKVAASTWQSRRAAIGSRWSPFTTSRWAPSCPASFARSPSIRARR
jgi:membrane fusion protein (multidrug efflux system)